MTERVSFSSDSKPPATLQSNKGNVGSSTTTSNEEELLRAKIDQLERDLAACNESLQAEHASKRRMYLCLAKIAKELKRTRAKADDYQKEMDFATKRWYQGGMWRTPEVLPGLGEVRNAGAGGTSSEHLVCRQTMSATDLFLYLVIVTAFSRVGVAVQDRGTVDAPVVAFFAVFWSIWNKEISYSSRFDTTDLSSITETMLTCFAVLFGCISCTETFQSTDATRIMMIGAFVAALHFLLHYRIFRLYRTNTSAEAVGVRKYARYIMWMTAMEVAIWVTGILFFPVGHSFRWAIFLVAILLGLRSPRSYLASDYQVETTDRNVLFILLLGFTLQSLVKVASPFFDYQSPSLEQYLFLGAACLLLFCIKLMYVDDSKSIEARDHALFVSRVAGFFFNIGQFCLLLAMTVLGSGMDMLTHSYLAAQEALPDNAKKVVYGGFSAIVLLNAFLKSLHIRRMPKDMFQQYMFYFAYGIQLVVSLTVIYVTFRMCFDDGFYSLLQTNEIVMLFVLSGASLFMVIISWLDEVVELSLYKEDDASQYRIHAFYLWPCLKVDDLNSVLPERRTMARVQTETLSLLSNSSRDLRMTTRMLQYDSMMERDGA